MGKAFWDRQQLGGYAGLKFTAKLIIEQIPDISKYNLWVEPFSGLGRTAEYVKLPKVLNDKSEYANNYCKEEFPDAIVENIDFMETINKYDSPTTFFLIDPPWRSDIYDFNKLTVCDRKIPDYYSQVFDRVKTLKGDWFILSDEEQRGKKHIIANSGYGTKVVITEKKVIFGLSAKTLICSNLFSEKIKDNMISTNDLLCDICGYLSKDGNDFNEHLTRKFHLSAIGQI